MAQMISFNDINAQSCANTMAQVNNVHNQRLSSKLLTLLYN